MSAIHTSFCQTWGMSLSSINTCQLISGQKKMEGKRCENVSRNMHDNSIYKQLSVTYCTEILSLLCKRISVNVFIFIPAF